MNSPIVPGAAYFGFFWGNSDRKNDGRFFLVAGLDLNGIKLRPKPFIPLKVDRVFAMSASVLWSTRSSTLDGEGIRKNPLGVVDFSALKEAFRAGRPLLPT